MGSWIHSDLGSTQSVCTMDTEQYNGSPRQYHFDIAKSTDGNTFTNVFSGGSGGSTANSEKYTIPTTDANM
jgi:hypothetical protein